MSAAQSLSEVACKAGTGSKALRNIPVKCIASFEVPGTSAMLHESLHADEGHCAGAQGEELHEFVEATLRGRQLKGHCLKLPDGYVGFVVANSSSGCGGSQDGSQADGAAGMVRSKTWQATTTFDRLTYYNHDTEPSRTDVQRRAFDWLAMAQQVHAPVSLAQVEAMLGTQA